MKGQLAATDGGGRGEAEGRGARDGKDGSRKEEREERWRRVDHFEHPSGHETWPQSVPGGGAVTATAANSNSPFRRAHKQSNKGQEREGRRGDGLGVRRVANK